MKLSKLICALAFMAACVSSVNATIVANYDFAGIWVDGVEQPNMQGWTFNDNPGEWRGWVPPGNFGAIYFNHNGVPGNSQALSPMIAVNNNQEYTLSFDYATSGQTQSVNVHFYKPTGEWLAVGTTVFDEWAWGNPSLAVTTTSAWTAVNKSATFNTSVAGQEVGYVLIQLIHGATWGETWFDNVQLSTVPEPATTGLLGLGALGLLRKKKA